jgi:hypothetical protein
VSSTLASLYLFGLLHYLNLSSVALYSNSDALAQLVTDSRDFMGSIAKAKTARLSERRFLRLPYSRSHLCLPLLTYTRPFLLPSSNPDRLVPRD